MSTTGLMSIGLRAMLADSASLQVTGHNIANANVAGYSRQDALLATNTGQFTGAGYFGKGVNVVDVRRANDQFLTMQAQAAKSLSSMDDTRWGQLQQLEDVFPAGEQGLGSSMGTFLNSMVDLANAPSDSSARQVVLARASDVAARFATASARLDTLQQGVTADLQTSVGTVNGLAASIASLNQQIAAVNGLSQKPNDLLDQRDQLISQLGQYVQVTTVPASDGSLGVFIAGGQRLVLGTEASTLVVKQDDMDSSRSALAIDTAGQELPIGEGMLTGGSLAGLLQFQNKDLVDSRNRLGQMARTFGDKVNEAQSLGLSLKTHVDASGNVVHDAGEDIFSMGAPLALASSNNARDVNGNLIAQVSLSITDATELQASDYTLTLDPTGAKKYQLTRLSDGLSRSVDDGESVDGFKISVGTELQTGDRFLLQPVGRAASGMTRVMDDPNGVAAASPLTATVGTANTGTASVASLTMEAPAGMTEVAMTFGATSNLPPGTTLEDGTVLTAATDAVAYTWTATDANGVPTTGTGYWVAGHPIGQSSGGNFKLMLNGVPANGDTVKVAATEFPATSNGNALQMAALRDERFVGRSVQPDGSVADGATVTDAYANAMADVGVRVQSAQTSAKISASVSTQADAAVASKTGVNLDEEAARLIQFQQSYQAAAKVLQVAQAVFTTMLQIGQ